MDDVQGYVHLLNRNDGSLVGRVATDGTPAVSQPVRTQEGVLVLSQAGNLYYVTAR